MSSAVKSLPIHVQPPELTLRGGGTLEDVISAFHDARAAVAKLFGLAGLDPTKTRETARDLGINRGLTWRLTRMVRESDLTRVASDVPGAASMARFFEACRQRGASEEAISSAFAAIGRFESALSACSGDRKTLAMLLANRGETRASTETEKARRKLFEGACSVWGVQAQVRFVTVFVFPSPDDPKKLDAGHVTGFIGFRRLSPRAWPMSYEAVYKTAGTMMPFVKEPLDPVGVGEGQLQLLKDYCSPTAPKIEVSESGGYKRFELASGPVGNEGLTTCVFGTRLRRLYDRYSEKPDTAGFLVLLNTPVERVLFDMYMHRDLEVQGPPRPQLLDRLMFPHSLVEQEFERQSMPMAETASPLPAGPAGTLCAYIPWYSRMVEDVTTRIGKHIDEFSGSRFEMNYPPISTTLRRWFDTGPAPR